MIQSIGFLLGWGFQIGNGRVVVLFGELRVVVMRINNTDHDSFVLQSRLLRLPNDSNHDSEEKTWMSVSSLPTASDSRVMSQSDSPIPYFQASSRPHLVSAGHTWNYLVTLGSIWSHLGDDGWIPAPSCRPLVPEKRDEGAVDGRFRHHSGRRVTLVVHVALVVVDEF